MEYNLKEHGDHLEKKYYDFIQINLPTYELVWKLYIGNKGDDTKADITNYSPDRDKKRQQFSEYSYTILQSVIALNRLTESSFLEQKFENQTDEILDLQNFLLLFFTHLGRINDNVNAASSCLLNIDSKKLSGILEEFYYQRHILVHGQMIPMIFGEDRKVLLPILNKNKRTSLGWDHKKNNWDDITFLPTENFTTTIYQLYWDLIPKLKEIFGEFKNKINEELVKGNFSLKYEDNITSKINLHGTGFRNINAVSAYGLHDYNPNKH